MWGCMVLVLFSRDKLVHQALSSLEKSWLEDFSLKEREVLISEAIALASKSTSWATGLKSKVSQKQFLAYSRLYHACLLAKIDIIAKKPFDEYIVLLAQAGLSDLDNHDIALYPQSISYVQLIISSAISNKSNDEIANLTNIIPLKSIMLPYISLKHKDRLITKRKKRFIFKNCFTQRFSEDFLYKLAEMHLIANDRARMFFAISEVITLHALHTRRYDYYYFYNTCLMTLFHDEFYQDVGVTDEQKYDILYNMFKAVKPENLFFHFVVVAYYASLLGNNYFFSVSDQEMAIAALQNMYDTNNYGHFSPEFIKTRLFTALAKGYSNRSVGFVETNRKVAFYFYHQNFDNDHGYHNLATGICCLIDYAEFILQIIDRHPEFLKQAKGIIDILQNDKDINFYEYVKCKHLLLNTHYQLITGTCDNSIEYIDQILTEPLAQNNKALLYAGLLHMYYRVTLNSSHENRIKYAKQTLIYYKLIIAGQPNKNIGRKFGYIALHCHYICGEDQKTIELFHSLRKSIGLATISETSLFCAQTIRKEFGVYYRLLVSSSLILQNPIQALIFLDYFKIDMIYPQSEIFMSFHDPKKREKLLDEIHDKSLNLRQRPHTQHLLSKNQILNLATVGVLEKQGRKNTEYLTNAWSQNQLESFLFNQEAFIFLSVICGEFSTGLLISPILKKITGEMTDFDITDFICYIASFAKDKVLDNTFSVKEEIEMFLSNDAISEFLQSSVFKELFLVEKNQHIVAVQDPLINLLPLALARSADGQNHMIDGASVSYVSSLKELEIIQNNLNESAHYEYDLALIIAKKSGEGDLPYGAIEQQLITAYFTDQKIKIFDASLECFDFTDMLDTLPKCKYWHFIAHGEFVAMDADKSRILLSDTLNLTLSNLTRLHYSACPRAVTLSSCGTAVTNFLEATEENVGFQRMFFVAGASAVLGSVWPVFDEASTLVMAKFYELHISEKTTPAIALQQAQLWLKNSTVQEFIDYLHFFNGLRNNTKNSENTLLIDLISHRECNGEDDLPFSSAAFWGGFTVHGL